MSKIALIASTVDAVGAWRGQTGLGYNVAPWVMNLPEVRLLAPYVSVICLPGWDRHAANTAIRDLILTMLPVTGRGFVPGAEEPDDAAVPPTPRHRPGAEAAIPSRPVLDAQSQALVDAGVNPALVGMLNDDARNGLRAIIGRGSFWSMVERVAESRGIPARGAPTVNRLDRPALIRAAASLLGVDCDALANLSDSEFLTIDACLHRADSAARLGSTDLVFECREILTQLLRTAEERDVGFLPPAREPGVLSGLVARASAAAAARQATNLVRDQLAEYMREQREADAERATTRRNRPRVRD